MIETSGASHLPTQEDITQIIKAVCYYNPSVLVEYSLETSERREEAVLDNHLDFVYGQSTSRPPCPFDSVHLLVCGARQPTVVPTTA